MPIFTFKGIVGLKLDENEVSCVDCVDHTDEIDEDMLYATVPEDEVWICDRCGRRIG